MASPAPPRPCSWAAPSLAHPRPACQSPWPRRCLKPRAGAGLAGEDRPRLPGPALTALGALTAPRPRNLPSLAIPWQTSSCSMPHSSAIMKTCFVLPAEARCYPCWWEQNILRSRTNRCGGSGLYASLAGVHGRTAAGEGGSSETGCPMCVEEDISPQQGLQQLYNDLSGLKLRQEEPHFLKGWKTTMKEREVAFLT